MAVFVLALVVGRGCQQSQVRISEEQAIVIAERQVNFEPEQVQVRMLRQGLSSKPFWIVSLSVPGRTADTFSELAIVRINANTGKVTDVKLQR